MTNQENRKILKGKKDPKEMIKKRKRKNIVNKKMKNNDPEESMTICLMNKPHSIVTNNKNMMTLNSDMINRKDAVLKRKCMLERISARHKLFRTGGKESLKRKSTKCTNANFIKEGKIKSCSLQLKTIKPMLCNAKSERNKNSFSRS